ncbi:MAG TPA: cytochrome c [Nitrospira sp.]|nr:cytochrome c [Nitrospira sp.]
MRPATNRNNQPMRLLAAMVLMLGAEAGPFADAGTGETSLRLAAEGIPGAKTEVGETRRGEALYRASCVVCHGAQAQGGIGPRLAGNPVLGNERAFWKTVHEGRHIMPPLKDTVTDEQLTEIRAWLQTLR